MIVPNPQTELDEVSYDPNYRVNWLGKILMFFHVRDNLKQSPCPLQKRGRKRRRRQRTRGRRRRWRSRGGSGYLTHFCRILAKQGRGEAPNVKHCTHKYLKIIAHDPSARLGRSSFIRFTLIKFVREDIT